MLYFAVFYFRFFNTSHISINKLSIVLISVDKLYWYFESAAIIFVTINPNTIKNIVTLYRPWNFSINYRISPLFGPMFEIHFDRFSKELALKLLLKISLKHVCSNLIILVVNHNDFESWWDGHIKKIFKKIWKIFDVNLQKLISVTLSTQSIWHNNNHVNVFRLIYACFI